MFSGGTHKKAELDTFLCKITVSNNKLVNFKNLLTEIFETRNFIKSLELVAYNSTKFYFFLYA